MKLKVWSQEESDKPVEKRIKEQLFVKIESCPEHGDIHILVVDSDGNEVDRGQLLILDADLKCLIICDHISDDVPLKTDVDGCLIYIEEGEYRARRREHMHQHFMQHIEQEFKKHESEVIPLKH